jgi:hypothetical protein
MVTRVGAEIEVMGNKLVAMVRQILSGTKSFPENALNGPALAFRPD